jgi:hypothetical protein
MEAVEGEKKSGHPSRQRPEPPPLYEVHGTILSVAHGASPRGGSKPPLQSPLKRGRTSAGRGLPSLRIPAPSRWGSTPFSEIMGGIWHQGQVARPLDGLSKCPLMSGTRPRDPPGNDLAPLRGKRPEDLGILVIDHDLVRAESTDLSSEPTSRPCTRCRHGLFSRRR